MSFLWAPMLVCLVGLPPLIVAYVLTVRRDEGGSQPAHALTVPPPVGSVHTRHRPFIVYFAAITLLVIGFARPVLAIGFPRTEGTVIVAIDSSTSMVADDVEPSRLDAAKAAAIGFVDQRPTDITIGLVSFTNGAVVTQAPSKSETDLIAAIERMQPEGPTSIGQGLLTALGALRGAPIALETPDGAVDFAAIDIGYFGASAVLVFSDGENTTDFDPLEIARLAANAGVKIFTVGVGTEGGSAIEVDGFLVATQLNTDDLRAIADVTGGQYFQMTNESELADIYESIDTELRIDAEPTEVTALAAGIGAVLLIVGAAMAMRQSGRLA